ncbi:uncharacterized protein B0I36DRAFT_353568 [Microdochium trichocladiopsis]|uniref:Uncharacterized protein n=1 Tax=Microdochium trichocladiopsis TaxID=1682393 RepID=A0A9P8XVA7_9PEZI|nr:uncharacterized protein B0I36DRAFT_353568 [Microdochium trichocladiopsis]KAH7020825.1 hypothetical protein B0I36DRAFT_353568 [Microdochium trichocladiopsis]
MPPKDSLAPKRAGPRTTAQSSAASSSTTRSVVRHSQVLPMPPQPEQGQGPSTGMGELFYVEPDQRSSASDASGQLSSTHAAESSAQTSGEQSVERKDKGKRKQSSPGESSASKARAVDSMAGPSRLNIPANVSEYSRMPTANRFVGSAAPAQPTGGLPRPLFQVHFEAPYHNVDKRTVSPGEALTIVIHGAQGHETWAMQYWAQNTFCNAEDVKWSWMSEEQVVEISCKAPEEQGKYFFRIVILSDKKFMVPNLFVTVVR